jgi:hypothetical protein
MALVEFLITSKNLTGNIIMSNNKKSLKKHYISPIVPVYRAGTPYKRLMQLSEITKKEHSVTHGFKSLISTGWGHWHVMKTYWCYSGQGHERMTVRSLPFSLSTRVEILGQLKTLHCWLRGVERRTIRNVMLFVRNIKHSVKSWFEKKEMRYSKDPAAREFAKFMNW